MAGAGRLPSLRGGIPCQIYIYYCYHLSMLTQLDQFCICTKLIL